MNRIAKALASSLVIAATMGTPSFADDHHDHDDHHYVHHEEWKKGARMRHEDWDRGERVDYRHYHLTHPPRGYEWREVDGNFVLAAAATGVIMSVVAATSAH